MSTNKVDVLIAGKSYTVDTPDTPEYVREVARELTARIESVMEMDDLLTVVDAAILIAMNLLDESIKETHNIDSIRTQIKSYVDEAASARREANEARVAFEEVQARVSALETDIELEEIKEKLSGASSTEDAEE